jgi:predicted nucleotide-binding protein
MPKGQSSGELPSPSLVVARQEARQKIAAQIEKGREILRPRRSSEAELENARNDYGRWSSYNTELLTRVFDNRKIADEYDFWIGFSVVRDQSFSEEVDEFRRDVEEKIHRLESIEDRLELIPERGTVAAASASGWSTPVGTEVFVVHGRDEGARESVVRFLERLGLRAVVLHEQPSSGRTIIEKLDAYSNLSYAVVLLTPDDVGFPAGEAESEQPRARQNVIFELGYFVGKLGRSKIVALYKTGVELPSDYHGVVYVPMDTGTEWQLRLAREMKHAGISVDLNKIL